MGVDPPFLYDPPSRYSNPYVYNPKAVTQASYAPRPERPKQEGPLVNFNRHPDSYLILPYGNTDAKQMSPRTKGKVKYTRWVLQFFRLCQLLGAIGLLICAICVRGVDGSVGWMIRVPAAVAIVHELYAIYHLCRRSSARTPASTASYMLFAAATDVGLVPFYIFAALVSGTEQSVRVDNPSAATWRSVFNNEVSPTDEPTSKIIHSLYLLGITNAGMHVVSLLICIYLAVIFRQIDMLPPDMNPLESNLTSRHKKKNSSISEKHMSTSTTGTSFTGPMGAKRDSKVDDPLLTPPRTIPFMHTRTNSTESFSNPNSPRHSRADLPSQLLHQKRASQASLSRARPSPTKRASVFTESASITGRYGNESPKKHGSLLTDNWYVHVPMTADDEVDEFHEEDIGTTNLQAQRRMPSDVSSLTPADHMHASRADAYEPLPQLYDNDASLLPHPLAMNPPTPQPETQQQLENTKRTLTPGSGNRAPTPKAKAYGDLKPGTPPIMVGRSKGTAVDLPMESTRVVSSGRDWKDELNRDNGTVIKKREVSGKLVEEGRAGWSGWRKGSRGWKRT
ncbi:MAG: hypothetical protein M1824_006006 [Vezdaea acicularis]|nr:MAG: hypothetical protein M1824_006006 [Vezdaea acicularis]